MIIETLSTFPSMYDSVMGTSMMRIAQEKGIITFKAHDLRDWTHDRHRTTDDDPYGGGDGLVMKCEPIFEAWEAIAGCHPEHSAESAPPCHPERSAQRGVEGSRAAAAGSASAGAMGDPSTPAQSASAQDDKGEGATPAAQDDKGEGATPAAQDDKGEGATPAAQDDEGEGAMPPAQGAEGEGAMPAARTDAAPRPCTIFLAPHGEPFDDALACELAREERLLFVCGHYEGIDERAYALADRVISLGDYVLTSGELASMVVIDAVVRKLPGVLGAETGAEGESFADGLLEHPQYTRPATYRGMDVPAVLLSGNHAAVARWRRERSLARTARLRPDLLAAVDLAPSDREFLLEWERAERP